MSVTISLSFGDQISTTNHDEKTNIGLHRKKRLTAKKPTKKKYFFIFIQILIAFNIYFNCLYQIFNPLLHSDFICSLSYFLWICFKAARSDLLCKTFKSTPVLKSDKLVKMPRCKERTAKRESVAVFHFYHELSIQFTQF